MFVDIFQNKNCNWRRLMSHVVFFREQDEAQGKKN